jgi:hypothetical protein
MKKSIKIVSLIILLVFIIGSIFILTSCDSNNNSSKNINEPGRYTMIITGNIQIIFDTQTGAHWSKYIQTNGGPNEWVKEELPE